MLLIAITHQAVEYLAQETGLDLESAEEVLQVCITMCAARQGDLTTSVVSTSDPVNAIAENTGPSRRGVFRRDHRQG